MTRAHAISDPFRRLAITGACMLSSMIVVIDSTIASVALPHMQATTGASTEEVMWVLTSYMVAAAIATPLSGWLAERYGRKRVILVSLVGFTLASLLCGAASSLVLLVVARALQGISGAGLQPLAQATLLDITPPENHARVLATQGMASMVGPLFGPTLGGWLTDALSWRWVFFINLPLGILAISVLGAFLPAVEGRRSYRLDGFGFAMLALAVAALQLLLDRGEQQDWMDSVEIRCWLALVGLGCWCTLVHTLTARAPFVRAEMFRDWNFTVGCIIGVTISLAAFGTQPITIFLLQGLLGYTALQAGTLLATSSLASLFASLVLGTWLRRRSIRGMMVTGIVLISASHILYARTSLQTDQWHLMLAGLVKGAGMGLLFTALPGLMFATLDPALRNEASAFSALTRNVSMSVGISLTQIFAGRVDIWTRSHLAEGIRADNPLLAFARPGLDLAEPGGLAAMGGEVVRQAMMVSYVNAYWITGLFALVLIPLVLLVRVRD